MHRIMGWRTALAASVALAAFGTARAQTAAPHDGDFIGTLDNPGAPLTVAIHLGASAQGQTATIGVVEFGSRGAPLTNVAVTGAKLHFDDPDAHAVYDATWDGHRWNGAWTAANGQALPLSLSPGLPPPLPRIQGLDGDWKGGIDAGAAGTLHLVLHIRTGADGTTGTLDSPDQGAAGLPVLVSREGRNVGLNMAIMAARYQGELSEDGASMKGSFSRGQLGLPLTFTRASQPN
jgi:hypothetical protein